MNDVKNLSFLSLVAFIVTLALENDNGTGTGLVVELKVLYSMY